MKENLHQKGYVFDILYINDDILFYPNPANDIIKINSVDKIQNN